MYLPAQSEKRIQKWAPLLLYYFQSNQYFFHISPLKRSIESQVLIILLECFNLESSFFGWNASCWKNKVHLELLERKKLEIATVMANYIKSHMFTIG